VLALNDIVDNSGIPTKKIGRVSILPIYNKGQLVSANFPIFEFAAMAQILAKMGRILQKNCPISKIIAIEISKLNLVLENVLENKNKFCSDDMIIMLTRKQAGIVWRTYVEDILPFKNLRCEQKNQGSNRFKFFYIN